MGVPGDLAGEIADIDPALPGQRGVSSRDVERLVPPTTGILGGEVWSVGLSKETIGGDEGRRGAEPLAPGVRECPGERHVQPEIEPCRDLGGALAVAVDHPADLDPFAENRPHAVAGIAHVNHDREPEQ